MFNTILIQPLYNVFVYLIGVMPGGSVGFAIVVMTIVIRALFYPAFSASIKMQMSMAAVQAELDEINEKYKDDSTERAKQTMQLYKDKNIRPLAGFVAILVQIPVLIALYIAFFKEGLPHIAVNELYSFVHAPANVSLVFLGILNLQTAHNIILGVIVGFLQYMVVRLTVGRTNAAQTTISADKAQALRIQQNLMLYAMPVLYAVISYSLPSAAGLYFAVTNLISLGQELLIRRQLRR